MRTNRLAAAIAAATTLTVLAGCGSSEESTAASTTSCGSSQSNAAPATTDSVAPASSFPVTIKHVYGETVVEAKPERVASVAWTNHEVPLALGVVPVGMSKATWGDDDNDGVLPWVEDKLTELGAKTPVLFDETDGIDFEAVRDTDPDVILASYSGLTEDDYKKLSGIAPTVAYPEIAWGTSVDDTIRMNSQAMGLAAEGEQLIADLDAVVADAFAQYPQLADKCILFTYLDPKDLSQIGFYTSHDTRPGFLNELGLPTPKLVEERSAKTEGFYETISAEQGDQLNDVDVFVTYGPGDGSAVAMAQADPLLSKIPAVKNGAIAVLEESTPLAASANPSPLSIEWGIKEYFAILAAAADKAK